MDKQVFRKATAFYNDVINTFGERYPRLMEENIGIISVFHAFEDKLPLTRALLKHNLLLGGILKKSSSEMQHKVAKKLKNQLEDQDLLITRSNTTYANSLPTLSQKAKRRSFIIGDHGGYYAHSLSHLKAAFGKQLIGVTEHTLNGETRLVQQFKQSALNVAYLSTAKIDLKERSDRDIAQAIVQEIITTSNQLDKQILSSSQNLSILLVGYGTMGFHTAQKLKNMNCQAEIIVTDTSYKKLTFALQDGFFISDKLENVLPRADIIILATNVIKGMNPVLTPYHFSKIKKNACITSMTSMDDEVDQEMLLKNNIIKHVKTKQNETMYSGPKKNPFYLMQNGRPANASLIDGGAGESIYLVEAAGLAGSFFVAQHAGDKMPSTLPDEDGDIIAKLWLKHFHPKLTPYN